MLACFILMQIRYASTFITSNPYRGRKSDTFYGLSSLFISGEFNSQTSSYSVTIGARECRVIEISDKEIECLIPPWDENDPASPQLEVIRDSVSVFTKSLNYAGKSPLFLTSNTAEAVDDQRVYFLNLVSGDATALQCSIEDRSMTVFDDYHYILDYWAFYSAMSGIEHGSKSLHINIDGSSGSLLWVDEQYTPDEQRYNFRSTASITSISAHEGDSWGGLELTISGKSFVSNSSRITVEADGVECNVQTSSFDSITCITRPSYSEPDSEFYEGSTGVKVYDFSTGNFKGTQLSLSVSINNGEKSKKFKGFFKAPRTGKYTFYLVNDDFGKLYLSTDSTSGNMKLVLDCNRYSFTRLHFYNPNCESSPIQLTENSLYYFELHFTHDEIAQNLHLGVEIPSESGKLHRNRLPLVKKIELSRVDKSKPLVYKGEVKAISNDLTSFWYGKLYSRNINAQYYSIHSYYIDNYLYAMIPSYIYQSPDDLKFNLASGGGEDPGVVVKEPSDSQFWFSVPSEFLRTYETTPQLRVWVDGRLAMCAGDCSFTYKFPKIQGFSKNTNEFTITGVNFPEDKSIFSAAVGPSTCEVTANSKTSIVCQLESYQQGEFQVEIRIQDYEPIKSEGYITLTCPNNCKVCTLPTKCIECFSGWNLYKETCTKICPTGFKCSETSYKAQGPDTVFEFRPQGIQKVVTDPYNSIPVKAGTGDQFYPFFTVSDPYPAKRRGYYFKGSSYMKLPPYESVQSPILVFAQEFSLSVWFKSETFQGTILSKASNQTKVEISLQSRVYSTIEGITYYSSSTLDNNWNLAMVTVSASSNSRRLQQGVSSVFCQTEFEDTDRDFNFVIGANATLQEFFQGFIWEIKVYKSPRITPEFSLNCRNCNLCPLGLNDCLPECGILQFWNGQYCEGCLENCRNGCINNSTCSLCGNLLCTECNFEVCTKCVENATLNSNKTCQCLEGYYSEYGFCVRGEFYAELYSNSNNTVTLKFSEPLNSELLSSDYSIRLQNDSIYFEYTVVEVSNSTYNFELEFNQSVSAGEVLLINFNRTSEIESQSKFALSTKSLQTQLSEYQLPEPDAVKQARLTGQVLAGAAVTSAVISSAFNPNPAALWAMLNTIQILAYIPLSTNPLTPSLRALFSGLDILEVMIPNPFEYIFDPDISPNYKEAFKNFGLESSSFVINAGKQISIISFIVLLWPLTWALSKTTIPFIARKCRVFLLEYKYNIFLRSWIQFYLDLAIYCLIQLLTISSSTFVLVSFCLGVFCGLLILLTPLALVLFYIKNKSRISSLSEESIFYRYWGTLMYEYRCQEKFAACYTHLVFVLKRLLFAGSLVFLGSYSFIQHSINLALVVAYTAFMITVKPFKDSIAQVTTVVTEIGICLVLIGCYYFLQDSWKSHYGLIETLLIYLTLSLVIVQSLKGVLPLAITIVELIKKNCTRSPSSEVIPIQNSGVLAFFRRNQSQEQDSQVLEVQPTVNHKQFDETHSLFIN